MRIKSRSFAAIFVVIAVGATGIVTSALPSYAEPKDPRIPEGVNHYVQSSNLINNRLSVAAKANMAKRASAPQKWNASFICELRPYVPSDLATGIEVESAEILVNGKRIAYTTKNKKLFKSMAEADFPRDYTSKLLLKKGDIVLITQTCKAYKYSGGKAARKQYTNINTNRVSVRVSQ